MGMCSFKPSTLVAETGGAEVQSHLWLHSKFEVSLVYVRFDFQKKKKKSKINNDKCLSC